MNIRSLILAMFLALATPSISQAGNNDTIETIGIRSVDSVFSDAADIDSRLSSAQKKRKKARKNVNEVLGLDPKTSFSDSLSELSRRADGKVKVVMNGSVPTLKATDAVPSDIDSAISAVNTAVSSYATMLTNLRDVPQDSKQIARKVQKMNVSDLRSEMGSFSLSEISTRIQQVRTFRTNVTVTAGLPKKANNLVQNLGGDVQAVRDVFPSR
jgi:hypothetical protein